MYIMVIILHPDLRHQQISPESAARAKCEKLRVVKMLAVGRVRARFSKELVAADLEVRRPVKGAKFSRESPPADKLCRFPTPRVRR